MTDAGSTVELFIDGVDIAPHATISGLTAEVAANANPGTIEIILKDVTRTLSFTTGKRIKLRVDGQYLWAGYLLNVGRSNFFPAGDGHEDTGSRQWRLQGVDNNILLDKRVLRKTTNYTHQLPNITTNTMDGALLRYMIANYVDWPAGFDGSGKIDDVTIPAQTTITTAKPWAWLAQGTKIREQFDDFARWSGAVYYIGPDDAAHYHALQTVESPWGFSDRPNHAALSVGPVGFQNAYYGFRELDADEDGSEIVTDAFVWGGGAPVTNTTVFHRATDAGQETLHSKWQWPEVHFGETNYKTQENVNFRANMIVFGNPGGTGGGAEPGSVVGEGPRGLRFPQWSYSLSWFAKDVPFLGASRRHIYPGDILPIQLWAFSQDSGVTPFSKFLPLRQLRISFPSPALNGKAHVRFDGLFDLRNDDSFALWKFLRQRQAQVINTSLGVVTNSSTQSTYGAFGQFAPSPAPNGSITVFTIPFPYISGTSMFYKNGLLLARGTAYTESDPDTGQFTLASPPAGTDTLWVTVRTQAASA